MKRIGMMSETFDSEDDEVIPKRKQLVRMIVSMFPTGGLQGCDNGNPTTWTSSTWMVVTLLIMIFYLNNQVTYMKSRLEKYQRIWNQIRILLNIDDKDDPMCNEDDGSDSTCKLEEGGEEEPAEEDEDDCEELLPALYVFDEKYNMVLLMKKEVTYLMKPMTKQEVMSWMMTFSDFHWLIHPISWMMLLKLPESMKMRLRTWT